MIKTCTLFIFIFSLVLAQDDSAKIYWNSLSTHVTVGVPITDDESLEGGRVQVKVSFDQGKTFNDLGKKFEIERGDLDDLKEVSISQEIFELSPGFSENGVVQFIAQVWDRAGNSIVGSVSDSILNIDQTLPEGISLELTSSNLINPNMVMPGDSITLQLSTSENITSPLFRINGEDYEGSLGLGKSWMFVFFVDGEDDGLIEFKAIFEDLAGNPGKPISIAPGAKTITMDGTLPELSEVAMFTSNKYDSTLAIKGDTVFLNFKSSEKIRDIKVNLNYTEAKIHKESELDFTFYHVFTENDSEGVIPIEINYIDLAGNLGESVSEASEDTEVNYDMTPPAEFKVEKVGSLKGDIQKLDNTDETSGSENKKMLNNVSLAILITLGITFLVIWVSWFKIFSKAGQSGWKAFIPILNIVVFTKIVDKPIWWLGIYLILPIGYFLSAIQISKRFDKKIIFTIGMILLPIVFFPLLAFSKTKIS